MLFDEKNYYFFIDEVSFDAQAIFAKNNGYDICKRKIITYYGDKNNPVKEVKTADNYFKIKDTNDKVITKYYIETFKINNFELVDQTYVKIFGLGCYFASFIGQFGSSVAIGYLKTFIIYTISCLVVYFIVYSIYAYIAGGKKGVTLYWKNIIPPTVTSLATCSSAACIPVNTACAKKIGVPEDIADTTIPLGTSFHKDGSIIGSVFKIMFLVYLFGMDVSIIKVLGVSLIATILITAVPIGGGTISEMLIISLMGFPIASLPILTIIATIIDAPATVLNVVGDSASSMLVAKIVDGKKWITKKSS